jgi:hypothetical protein
MLLKRIADLLALLAFLVWAWLCGRALTGSEAAAAARWRTWAFGVMIGAGTVAFPRRR